MYPGDTQAETAPTAQIGKFHGTGSEGPIRRRTLTLIRWIAIVGQSVALFVAEYWLHLAIPLVPLTALILASALVNLATPAMVGRGLWLTEAAAARLLGFDLLQLSGLLVLTGGLSNPFSVLILAPVTVSASTLSARSTAILVALAVTLETVLAVWYLPMPWFDGALLMEPLFIGSIWAGLVLATVFIAVYVASLASEGRAVGHALAATQAALSREQQLASLGGLAALVTHELGSPLSTIKLVAKELQRDIPEDSPWRADIDLLTEEVERCGVLLAEMAVRPATDSGMAYNLLPVLTLMELAAEPHSREEIRIRFVAKRDPAMPLLPRDPALLHGIGTLLQNAIQFAKSEVVVTCRWNDKSLTVLIADDGLGFDPALLDRLGEPYLSSDRPDPRAIGSDSGSHMGLGVFIAKTLLGHRGASIKFSNPPLGGAEVAISWQLDQIRMSD
ncbi:MAG: ActS/PrrB/RegB family redox-sensitive histidine kinase [Rhodospirillales bacterium]|nr:ActS/PrrB/RegB family redox-sensitive histidine kinase [Rhodospirillales bacterium]